MNTDTSPLKCSGPHKVRFLRLCLTPDSARRSLGELVRSSDGCGVRRRKGEPVSLAGFQACLARLSMLALRSSKSLTETVVAGMKGFPEVVEKRLKLASFGTSRSVFVQAAQPGEHLKVSVDVLVSVLLDVVPVMLHPVTGASHTVEQLWSCLRPIAPCVVVVVAVHCTLQSLTVLDLVQVAEDVVEEPDLDDDGLGD